MNERIRKLRKTLDLTQKGFAERIGIKQNTIATYEIGRSEPIDAVISLICREFNVSEEWLRTGAGKMFVERSRADELSVFVDQLLKSEPDDIRRRFVTAISRLSTVELEALEKTALLLSGETNNTSAVDFKMETTTQSEPDIMSELAELKRQNEEIQRQNQELAAKVAAMEEEDIALGLWDGSSASPSASAGSYNPSRIAKK